MLATLKNNRSLTFYQQAKIDQSGKLSASYTGGIIAGTVSDASLTASMLTAGYNDQLKRYLDCCVKEEQALRVKTAEFMDAVRKENPNPSTSMIRDKGNWGAVKKLVTREELMKLQISGKTSLPLTEEELNAIKAAVNGKDLSNISDKDVQNIIDSVVSRDQRAYLNALKKFRETGEAGELLQSDPAKLAALKKELDNIDLSKISNEQYKKLVENYCEKTEFHHRESISSDPSKQSVPDNVEPLKTSDHDAKHFDSDTGKINYKKPVKEKTLNRKQDMKKGNAKRVFKNELQGLGIAVAIGAGVGLTIGFITTLAQSGITPDSLKLAIAEGAKAGAESGAMSAVSYGIGRTIGQIAVRASANMLENIGITITENITQMVNMGVVGTMTIAVFSMYQFIKLKRNGLETKSALMQTGKQALISLSLLAMSIVAQGVWGGAAGMIVSISIGVIIVSYSALDSIYQRNLTERIRKYTIEQCYPAFA